MKLVYWLIDDLRDISRGLVINAVAMAFVFGLLWAAGVIR